jgi:hypothetical protein
MNGQEILRLYCGLMEEVKIRIDTVNFTYHNRDKLPAGVVREICYLQFRFICETIALACLAAHSEIKDQAVKRAYEPVKIMSRLEKLNPHFYPQPVEQRRVTDSKGPTIIAPRDINYLSKKELKELWIKAGGILHRGSMIKILREEKFSTDDYADIFEWSEKITGLLNTHWITLVESQKGLYVSLISKETNRTAATIFDFDTEGSSVGLTTVYLSN